MISLDNVEADDTIAYCTVEHFKDWNVNIMSSDKDFFQLVNDHVRVWSPTKKRLYGPAEVLEEYGIHPHNFAIFRALDGDTSDNIPGVKGCGLKTVLKAFPFLADAEKVPLQKIFYTCERSDGKLKLYEKILAEREIVERNYQLMQLEDTLLQTFAQLAVKENLDTPITRLNRFEFSKLITEDKLWSNIPNYQTWVSDCFTKLDHFVIGG
jgi:DNA polymerase-1